MLHLITYNILFGRRLQKIIPWIKDQKTADVICFQEFPKVKLLAFRQSLSPEWGCQFTQTFLLFKKTYGLVTIYRKEKMHLEKTETFLMGVHPLEKSFLGNPLPKSCLFTTFRIGKKLCTVANTHLVFLAANRARYKQIRMIIDHGAKFHHPFIITGDFNIPSRYANNKLISYMKIFEFQTILKRLRSYRIAGFKWQLDYIFVKHCRLVSLELERVKFSDHYPVIATVAL
jgi:endonuclease/exonuclease/phosphatase family metal-dependent hydrolase